jgi:hypothetical protein
VEGSVLVRDPLYENRTITMKLRVIAQASMDTALDKVAALRDKLAKASATRGGIALVWTPGSSARSRTFDVLGGEITGLPISTSGDGASWWLTQRPIVTVELTAKPYWRDAEVTTSTASSSTPFVTLEIANVPGDIDALGRIIVTDTATQSRRHVEWGLEGPATYNSSTSLLVDSDAMATTGFTGTQTTATGAYDPNASGNSTITATPVPGQVTAVCGTGNLSHVGMFRVKARIQAGSLSNLFRLSWRSGDGPTASNDWVTPISTLGWIEIDLGMITIATVTSGTQRWTGQIEVQGATSSPGTVLVDYMTLVPVIDGYGVARTSYTSQSGVVTGYDKFIGTTAAAALGVRAAPLGGSWATSGDATDFVFGDTFNFTDTVECIARATAVVETTGRFAILGSTSYTNVMVSVLVYYQAAVNGDWEQAIVARWVDSSNYLRLIMPMATGGVAAAPKLEQVVAGTPTTLAVGIRALPVNTTYQLVLMAYATGGVTGLIVDTNGLVLQVLTASSSAIATGGALATGKPGIRDRSTSVVGPASRPYTSFSVGTPPDEKVAIYSGRTMQFRYDTTIRDDSTGTYTGRPWIYEGSRVTIPVGTSSSGVRTRYSTLPRSRLRTRPGALWCRGDCTRPARPVGHPRGRAGHALGAGRAERDRDPGRPNF